MSADQATREAENDMITIVKLTPQGQVAIRYEGEVVAYFPNGAKIEAYWTLPARDLGYARFEPGDRFLEYYYTDHWFNIFAIFHADGRPKGWYCNIAEPAIISNTSIQQVDLFLDVWISTTGAALTLDEDEFNQASDLSEDQRQGAREGLKMLLHLLHTRQEPFTILGNPGD